MFRINSPAAQTFYSQTPETFKAIQHLVMAMDDFCQTKKSWYEFATKVETFSISKRCRNCEAYGAKVCKQLT